MAQDPICAHGPYKAQQNTRPHTQTLKEHLASEVNESRGHIEPAVLCAILSERH